MSRLAPRKEVARASILFIFPDGTDWKSMLRKDHSLSAKGRSLAVDTRMLSSALFFGGAEVALAIR